MADKQQALKAQIDDKLDQALKDSFPASDPVSFLQPVPMKDSDRKLPVVEAANDRAALRASERPRQPVPDPFR